MPNIQFQVRRGTATTWTSTNPKLANGEFGFETDTRQLKIGNDASWNAVPYINIGQAANWSTFPAFQTMDMCGNRVDNATTVGVSRILSQNFSVGNGTLGSDYTVTTSGGRTFYNFLGAGKIMTFTTTTPQTIEYFAVGGGGGGGGDVGGGGGAGGLRQATSYSLPAGTYNITIGTGGAGGSGRNTGVNGADTIFGSITTALGGGGGGSAIAVAALGGGCGGGAGYYNTAGGVGSQGFNGGGAIGYNGAGGGGIGGPGQNDTGTNVNAGNGGVGLPYNNGTLLQLGGGGGGAQDGNSTGTYGLGSFGGGNGGGKSGIAPTSGSANTGGGGGGGLGTGGAGGSGILILAFNTATPLTTLGTLSTDVSNNFTVSAVSNIRLTKPTDWRYITQDVSATTLSLTTSNTSSVFRLTNGNLTTLALPTQTAGDAGIWWQFYNNSGSNLSLTLTGTVGLTSPQTFYNNGVYNLYWNGISNYILKDDASDWSKTPATQTVDLQSNTLTNVGRMNIGRIVSGVDINTGGALTSFTSNGFSYSSRRFTANASFVVVGGSVTAQIVLVGGGGGGAGYFGGGGAGGGLLNVSDILLPVGTYTITIGSGGSGGTDVGNGFAGSNTTITNGTLTYTIAGGSGGTTNLGPGGAGAGGSASGVNGGAGLGLILDGSTTTYLAGGGGAGRYSGAGSGGIGGGGGGAINNNGTGGGGGTNTGGGGGGGSGSSASGTGDGGAGGSGVAYVIYQPAGALQTRGYVTTDAGQNILALSTSNIVLNAGTSNIDLCNATLLNARSIRNAAGTVSAPSYTFTNDLSTGLFYDASSLTITTRGTETARFTSSNITMNRTVDMSGNVVANVGSVRNGAGTVSAPSYTFTADLSMGLYDPASNVLGFVTSGVERMRLDATGGLQVIGSELVRQQGTASTTTYGYGLDTLTLQSTCNAYANSVSSIAFGNATTGYPLGRIYVQDSASSGPALGTMVIQNMVTNTSSFTTNFSSLASDQTFTVPTGVTTVQVTMWGGGGGGRASLGGAGAYVRGTMVVVPGQTYTVVVGANGKSIGTGFVYGGGGSSTNGQYNSGSGGGRSAIQLNLSPTITSSTASGSAVTYTCSGAHGLVVGQPVVISGLSPSGYNGNYAVSSISSSTQFVVVSGQTGAMTGTGTIRAEIVTVGGGGGGSRTSSSATGGAATFSGTAFSGQPHGSYAGGGGGTQSGGGSIGGLILKGGTGNEGAGGGGGYYGGGAGDTGPGLNAGGGGGSSYISHPNFTLIVGSNSPNSQNQAPGTSDANYQAGVAAGGSGDGGTGLVNLASVGNALAESIRISTAGNVGIGASAPADKLDVNGNVRTLGVRNGAGTVSAPSYTFTTDLSMGLYDPSTNVLGFVTSGVERMRVAANGNVGIGTTAPRSLLDVSGTIYGRLPVVDVSATSQTLTLGVNDNSYFYLTNSGFSNITAPLTTSTGSAGTFWTFKNATSSYLSVTLTNTLSLISPISIPPSNAVTLTISPTSSNTLLLF